MCIFLMENGSQNKFLIFLMMIEAKLDKLSFETNLYNFKAGITLYFIIFNNQLNCIKECHKKERRIKILPK